jgi:hypothetical protein
LVRTEVGPSLSLLRMYLSLLRRLLSESGDTRKLDSSFKFRIK